MSDLAESMDVPEDPMHDASFAGLAMNSDRLPRSVVVEVPIASLREADSPRLDGLDQRHVSVLAELDGKLPPILVNRSTMRVIDGMHRLSAAVLNGRDRIDVDFAESSEVDAFLLGVKANVTHGLPLTPADRRAAAERIVQSHPQLSNRSIAAATGLATKTVAAVRRQLSVSGASTNARVGRDGRIRPLDNSEGRRLAAAVIAARPTASLREIAKEAGISAGTAMKVRDCVQAGQDPAPPRKPSITNGKQPDSGRRPTGRVRSAPNGADLRSILHGLRQDPSLRYTDVGRSILLRLDSHVVVPKELENLIREIPPHSAILVSKIARQCAAEWLRLAKSLERKSNYEHDEP